MTKSAAATNVLDGNKKSTATNHPGADHGHGKPNRSDQSNGEGASTSPANILNSGFRMKVQPQQKRKRKRQILASASASSSTTGSNIFEVDDNDEDDDDDKRLRGRISMSLSGSSSGSSSDDDDGANEIDSVVRQNHSVAVVARSDASGTDAEKVDPNKGGPEGEGGFAGEMAAVTANEPSGGQNDGDGNINDDGTEHKNENGNSTTKKNNVAFVGNGGNEIDSIDKKKEPAHHHVVQNHNQSQQRQHHQQQQQQHKQKQQPEGWRVKLYRLNADGSWDDCGTGRILCLYKQKPSVQNKITSSSSSENAGRGDDGANTSSDGNPSSSNQPNGPLSDSAVYVELGEPTLCMHSEVSTAANNMPSSIQQQQQQQQQQTNINNNQNTAARNANPRILLRTRILLRDAYQRQGDNIITWCEPYLEEGSPAQGVDLALSFQENEGCIDIWRQITQVQARANEKFRLRQQQLQHQQGILGTSGGDGANKIGSNEAVASKAALEKAMGNGGNGRPLADLAHNVAAAHHANLQPQELWANVAADNTQNPQNNNSNSSSNNSNNNNGAVGDRDDHDAHHRFENAMGGIVAAYNDATSPGGGNALNAGTPASPQLPNPPTIQRIEEISDIIARVQNIHQRESLATYISQNDCYYLKSILSLFPPAEAKQDLCSLTSLAACVKTILLLNDPSILESIINDELVFEDICQTLEYDPDLRDKANHRWFLRERAKFRTVALMEDEFLIGAIHRSFRVNYVKDTLLRPTMDESSLSTLSSLQTFTHADVVKGVTMSPSESDERGDLLRDSYLAKVIRILGHEMDEICELEWRELESLEAGKDVHCILAKRKHEESSTDQSTVIASGKYPQSQKMSTIWKQHLAPQDNSMSSRRIRRRGSLSFLRELFNMVRISLHQNDKDDFFAVLVSMEVDLSYSTESHDTAAPKNDSSSQNTRKPSKPVNFLLLLATVLSDPETDVTDKGLVLEIIAGIAAHDASLIRRKCLDYYASCKNNEDVVGLSRPRPNGKKQVIFQCPPNDLLASLIFLLAIETDAGLLLQVTEIMRIILETDVMGDNRPMNAGFADEAEGIPPSGGHNPPHDQHPHPNGSGNTTSTEQNQFLSAFYEHYVQWLAAPFQYTILYPLLRFPNAILNGEKKSRISDVMVERFQVGGYQEEPMLHKVPFSALRSSFAVELLGFCVRAHQYRMKMYLLRSRVLCNVLKLIKPSSLPRNTSGDRCLKLAALRFLRTVVSVDEDMYHRHIIQDDLFGPVFEAFRANPVGDNLVSSSIVEMCDFINTKSINSLIEYIVTKHISATGAEAPVPSLEDVSSPYVSTLTCLRHAYETLVKERNNQNKNQSCADRINNACGRPRVVMNERAIEDQRRYREEHHEQSYFDRDDDDEE